LRRFLFEQVYNIRSAQEESERARDVVRSLYKYLNEHIDKLPPEYSFYSDEPEQRVVDYIAGMTDQYALNMAEELSLIKGKGKPQAIKKEHKGKTPVKVKSPHLF
jgi:dGTPase